MYLAYMSSVIRVAILEGGDEVGGSVELLLITFGLIIFLNIRYDE